MTGFSAPAQAFSNLGPNAVARLAYSAADVTLVVDAEGVIRDLAYGSSSLSSEHCDRWLGQRFIQTVSKDSRPKIEALLRDADSKAMPRWRQVNHPTVEGGNELPLSYCAVKVGDASGLVAHQRSVVYGRDLRAQSALQQSLLEAQQQSLQDHWKFREAQARYRHLFQVASDAVLILDAATQKVVEANPAADVMFGRSVRNLVGSAFPVGFNDHSAQRVQNMLTSVRASGRTEEARAQLDTGEVIVSGSMFRQDVGSLLVLRLTRVAEAGSEDATSSANATLLKLVQSAPDSIVVTDANGRIVSVNDAFLELVQLTSESQVRGESLNRWLGRAGVELNVLINTLRQRGTLRLFPSQLRDDHGTATDVEISGTLARQGEETFLGFTIRDVSRRPSVEARGGKELPRSAGQLAELVGRVPMKDIVGETTDLIEQLCIEAALELTRDNRAAAAEILGLSRQSLYVKLRRYGIGDTAAESEK